jgi:hypothetical protein
MIKITLFLFFLITFTVSSQSNFKLAVLKYDGGGDYYANPSSIPNLIKFFNQTFNTKIYTDVPFVEPGDQELFQYPFIHMTGHGNVVFSPFEAENLRNYLLSGGFLHIDDNYGMDQFIRTEIQKIFPNNKLVELPFDHPIFNQKFNFNSLPKIHEHDNQRPQAFGIIENGRLVCLYTFETDLGDGWEDEQVHNDTKTNRINALKMGINILMYAFNN